VIEIEGRRLVNEELSIKAHNSLAKCWSSNRKFEWQNSNL